MKLETPFYFTNVLGGITTRIVEFDILMSNVIVHIIAAVIAFPDEYPQV